MKNVCCDKVEQKSRCGDIEVGYSCENSTRICKRKKFIFDTFFYYEQDW